MKRDELPSGIIDYPGVGWPLAAHFPEWSPMPVPVGRVHVPRTFHTSIFPGSYDDPHDPEWGLTLMYSVEEGEVVLAMALAGGAELPELLEKVRRLRPLRWWQRRALRHAVQDEVERSIGNMRDAEELNIPEPPATAKLMSERRNWMWPADGSNAARAAWSVEQMRSAQTMPLGRRRGRITRQHLEEVAEVYRRAWEVGLPPTVAVAEHFQRPHSTAADWVVRARKEGVLGGADGTRGGEQS